MWSDIEARIAENDRERPNTRSRELLDVIRASGLVPNGNASKYTGRRGCRPSPRAATSARGGLFGTGRQ